MCKLKFYWFKIWITTNDKNQKESTIRIEIIFKRKLKEFLKVQTVYFSAFWSRFKFICIECIMQELNMPLNQEGGSISRVNIGRLITPPVWRHVTPLCFSKWRTIFLFIFFAKDDNFRRSGNFFCLVRMTKHLKNRNE